MQSQANYKKLNNNLPEDFSGKVLIIRLPCNPIFPIGPIYIADHLRKCFPNINQQLIDLAIVPRKEISTYLKRKIDQFRPNILIYSWRDIQIYAPVDGRSGNPLQNSFEVFYSKNLLKKVRGAWGGLKLITSHYAEINRNTSLVKMGLNRAKNIIKISK